MESSLLAEVSASFHKERTHCSKILNYIIVVVEWWVEISSIGICKWPTDWIGVVSCRKAKQLVFCSHVKKSFHNVLF